MKKKWADLMPGHIIHDMHDSYDRNSPHPFSIEEPHCVTARVQVESSFGVELIEETVLHNSIQAEYYYTNKHLVVLSIEDDVLKVAWSYDGLIFGMMSIRKLPQ